MNASYKRGIVLLNDPANGRSRVKIEDEDGVKTFWLAWNMPAAGKSKIFNAPDIGSQVNCLLDRNGEDGCILGARYSKADTTPTSDGNLMKALLEGGLDFSYNKGSGALALKAPGGLIFEAPNVTVKGNTDFTEGYVKSNGKRIDDTHTHGGIVSGPDSTSVPD